MSGRLIYPKLNIRSKNDLAKRISDKNFSYTEALSLINRVIKNHESLWKDSRKHSQPDKGKFVRDSSRTDLGLLLKKIDKKILVPNDTLLPDFIFGAKKKTSHITASKNLLGLRRKRSLLGMDIKSFFEQIKEERVYGFFCKSGCHPRVSRILALVCCVPLGEKGSGNREKSIARGFPTSPRLAVWCSINIFTKVERVVKKRLKYNDPKISIYVDDIGITASKVEGYVLTDLSVEIKEILSNFDTNQSLPISDHKTKFQKHNTGIEHLGLVYGKNSLMIGRKTKSRQDSIKFKYKISEGGEKKVLKNKVKSYVRYKKSVIGS